MSNMRVKNRKPGPRGTRDRSIKGDHRLPPPPAIPALSKSAADLVAALSACGIGMDAVPVPGKGYRLAFQAVVTECEAPKLSELHLSGILHEDAVGAVRQSMPKAQDRPVDRLMGRLLGNTINYSLSWVTRVIPRVLISADGVTPEGEPEEKTALVWAALTKEVYHSVDGAIIQTLAGIFE